MGLAARLAVFRWYPRASAALQGYFARLKGGRLEKWGVYWKGIYADYREVAVETVNDMKSRPKKAAAICGAIGIMTVAAKSNPNEYSFYNQLIQESNRLLLVNENIRNPVSDQHINMLFRCKNESLLRYFSVGIFSIIWLADFDSTVDIYASQCSYLSPQILTFHKRILDVGCFGRWLLLNEKMKDYDINPTEWGLI